MSATALRLTIRQWAEEDRPSNKLRNLGVQSLTDAELLAILIGSGTTQHSAVDIANHTLAKFDRDLCKLGRADFDELKAIEGIGTYTACKIMAAIELGRRRQSAHAGIAPDLSSATAIYRYMLPKMQDLKTEEAHVVLMNQDRKLIRSVRISQGGITETSVDVRIIIKQAVLCNATIIAFCHNHPSGSIRPSKADDNLTRSIKSACDLMRIHFQDHVIVTDEAYYSYHEQGKL